MTTFFFCLCNQTDMADAIDWRPPLLDSTKRISTVMRLNNITAAQIQSILDDIRDGTNQRPGFSEGADGVLLYQDARGKRQVVSLSDRDRVMEDAFQRYGHPGKARFHSLLDRKFANISMNKVARFYSDSETIQIMRSAPLQEIHQPSGLEFQRHGNMPNRPSRHAITAFAG